MKSKLLAVSLSLVAAGAIGTVLTVALWDDGQPLALPTPVITAKPPVTAAPTTLPTPTSTPTPAPTTASRPTAPPDAPPPTVDARNVNCTTTPKFCSQTAGKMAVRSQKLQATGSTSYSTDYSTVPKTTMTWQILRRDGTPAHEGDAVRKLVVKVSIFNQTNRTFVFPRRQVALVVARNGETFHNVATDGAAFRMTPGGRLNASFDIPIAYDGDYTWRAKTWFYEAR